MSSRDSHIRTLELELAAAPTGLRLERLEGELKAANEKLASAPKQQQIDRCIVRHFGLLSLLLYMYV